MSLAVMSRAGPENTSNACVSYNDNSLKKITLVNCLIIIILIIVIAANINEGNILILFIRHSYLNI